VKLPHAGVPVDALTNCSAYDICPERKARPIPPPTSNAKRENVRAGCSPPGGSSPPLLPEPTAHAPASQ